MNGFTMTEHRFAFGENWKRYSRKIGAREIASAKSSLSSALVDVNLGQASFLDIGSGSGIFSRAAHELGFFHVVSFDYDNDSVEATLAMREASGCVSRQWQVYQGSVLDNTFMSGLGLYDLVYSWGVLHHTGSMWMAVDNAARMVKPEGILFIALYNDQGWISKYWYIVKRIYVGIPPFLRPFMLTIFFIYFGLGFFFIDLIRFRNPFLRHIGDDRGMKFWTDVIDWVGGYPFEVASPEKVVTHLRQEGFSLVRQKLAGRRHGCNEFIFQRMIFHD